MAPSISSGGDALRRGRLLFKLAMALEVYETAVLVMDPKADREALRSLEMEIDLAEMDLLQHDNPLPCLPTAPAK